MITGTIKTQIDNIWNAFWSGGISNPMEVIEQMTYLLFIKRLDELQTVKEKKANRTKQPVEDPIFNSRQQKLRWSKFKELGDPAAMYDLVADEVFPFIKTLGGDKGDSTYATHMKDARFTIPTPALLARVVDMLDAIPMDDRDTKGDLYEYMLGKIASAGQNGQFRTPRHIIKLMVEMMAPRPSDTICDPACGTAGFLVAAAEYIREHYENTMTTEQWEHFAGDAFTGFDTDRTMLRLSAMNLMLHSITHPEIDYQDSVSKQNQIRDKYTICLANPPFKGTVDAESINDDLKAVTNTKKTELLFLALFLRMLKKGGRCACIVPDGVLFGSSRAHKAIRKELVENHQLRAVISMPSGVFKPYAGVSTAVLVFTKTGAGGTENVWFYDMKADGFSLDDKRTETADNDIPDIIARFHHPEQETARQRTDQSFFVPKQEIADNDYDLSINKYKKTEYVPVEYPSTTEIMADLHELEMEITAGLAELEEML